MKQYFEKRPIVAPGVGDPIDRFGEFDQRWRREEAGGRNESLFRDDD